ncbi:hypothetical protein SAVIM40S_01433 [Streptomyces avidinii]
MISLPPPVNSGMYRHTGASSSMRPRSICCTARMEVNSLVSEARSKTVSSAIAIRSASGNSRTRSVRPS